MNDKYLHLYVIMYYFLLSVIRYDKGTRKNNDFEKKIFIFLI